MHGRARHDETFGHGQAFVAFAREEVQLDPVIVEPFAGAVAFRGERAGDRGRVAARAPGQHHGQGVEQAIRAAAELLSGLCQRLLQEQGAGRAEAVEAAVEGLVAG